MTESRICGSADLRIYGSMDLWKNRYIGISGYRIVGIMDPRNLGFTEFPEVTDVPEIIYGSWLRVKDSWFGGDSYYSGDSDYRADVRCKREEVIYGSWNYGSTESRIYGSVC